MSKERFERMALMTILLLCAIPASAQSANICAPRETVISLLETSYGEVRQSVALAVNGALVESFVSPETGTWTIIMTTPDGIACLAANGHDFEQIDNTSMEGDPT